MLIPTLAFLLGVFLAPAVRPLFRPILVEIIRAALILVDEVRRMSSVVREGMEDAHAEAVATHRPAASAAPAQGGEAAAPAAAQSTT
jgi:hypothetical protein